MASSSNVMLDLSVSGLERVVDNASLVGWVLMALSQAGTAPPECQGAKPAEAPRYVMSQVARGTGALQLLAVVRVE